MQGWDEVPALDMSGWIIVESMSGTRFIGKRYVTNISLSKLFPAFELARRHTVALPIPQGNRVDVHALAIQPKLEAYTLNDLPSMSPVSILESAFTIECDTLDERARAELRRAIDNCVSRMRSVAAGLVRV